MTDDLHHPERRKIEYVEVKKDTLTMERIALTAVVALLSWNVYTTNQLTINQAVSAQQIVTLVDSVNSLASERYTKAEASAAFAVQENRFARFESAMERVLDRQNATNERQIALQQRVRDLELTHAEDNR